MTTRLLKNGKVILPDHEVETSVLIKDGKIAIVGDDLIGDREIDASNTTILPGFIDVHIHGAVGVDVMDATVDGLQQMSKYLASQGVTSWLPTFVPATDENYANAVDVISQSVSAGGARILGVHYEGPFVSSAQCGALHTEYFKTYSGPDDLAFLRVLPDAVQMMTLAPEVSGGVELVRELKRRGWVISIGHTRADLQVLYDALGVGATHMTHFMNAMPQLHHRNPGPVAWGLANDVTIDIIADGIHLHPFTLRLLIDIKDPLDIILISDAIAAAGKGDGDYQIWGETITVRNGRTANASGSIAGSVISMLDAVRLMRSLGVSYVDLADMASGNPARLLGVYDVCGSIEVGKRADLVLLDKSGNVKTTIIDGQLAFTA